MASQGDSLKVLLLGSSNVGKTQLMARFCRDEFSLSATSTVGTETETDTFMLGEDRSEAVKATLHDTAGQERFRAITTGFYREAHGAMLVYDVRRKQTLLEMDSWLAELRQSAPKECVLMLLGNKADLPVSAQSSVPTEEGLAYAEKHNMAFMEVSALSGVGVKEAFEALLNQCHLVRKQARSAAGLQGGGAAAAPKEEGKVTIAPAKPADPPAPGCC